MKKRISKVSNPLPPAKGTARWTHRDPQTGLPWLRIEVEGKDGEIVSQDYEVRESIHKDDTTVYWLSRFEEVNGVAASEKGYLVSLAPETENDECTCPDATHRPERKHSCKHIKALRAALPLLALKLPEIVPVHPVVTPLTFCVGA